LLVAGGWWLGKIQEQTISAAALGQHADKEVSDEDTKP
jgi:hypothetical protein